ncbi:ABC transporter permease [Clostridium sp. AL.422]|uniref:ABC transporter permease n=1 Tax=Clostridium TaxID=1485 RepID=UPI00293DF7A1|nr:MULTISPECIES: ABC transporter permease [unclassified Clostridium]MDV4151120.1 ABC transporter permease [Clostridium sp. AL.422]
MIKIMINTIKILFKKKSFIVMSIIAPSIIIVLFSFAFGRDVNYRVGIIDNDKNYISNEIIQTIDDIDNVDVVDISRDNYEILLISHQIQMVVSIEDGFSNKVLNLEPVEIPLKSISNSDIKETIVSIIKLKVDNLSLIAKISNKNIDVFKENNEGYKENIIKYNLNNIESSRPSIENSLGMVIMMIFISGSAIASFLIEDDENGTRERVLVSGIKPQKYYLALIIVFYLLSSISSIIYYFLCKLLNIDFKVINPNYFLIVMLLLNLVVISFNLFIVSFTKNRYITNIINILTVIPTCMMSGLFWDFEIMPNSIQRIGSLLPQRYVIKAIEDLQAYSGLSSIYDYIFYMIALSLGLFILSYINLER